jgi:CubicO group peptidase (beta-lactamase class C family)
MTEAIDTFINDQMAEQHLPALSILVTHDGETAFVQSYGLAHLELNVPAHNQSIYELGSVTKPFTATAIMLLAADHLLNFDDPITSYLSTNAAPSRWNSITVRQLLTHTAGISRDGIADYWSTPHLMRQEYSREHMLELLTATDLDFVPGTEHRYSNSGYFLLGLIIEAVTQQSFADVLNARIFQPLGMTETHINDRHILIPNRVAGYVWSDHGWENAPTIGLTHHFANGGLVSSIMDLAKWEAALTAYTLLSAEQLAQMWRPQTLVDGRLIEYGYGWMITQQEGHRLVAHGGAIPGFTAYIARFIDRGLSVVVLTNRYLAAPGAIARQVVTRFFMA